MPRKAKKTIYTNVSKMLENYEIMIRLFEKLILSVNNDALTLAFLEKQYSLAKRNIRVLEFRITKLKQEKNEFIEELYTIARNFTDIEMTIFSECILKNRQIESVAIEVNRSVDYVVKKKKALLKILEEEI